MADEEKKEEHVDIIKESKFNRQRADTHALRSNCQRGYLFTNQVQKTYKTGPQKGKPYTATNAAGQAQYHHILCISSISDGEIKPQKDLDYFHNCMAATNWDINASHNLIALPTKRPYERADYESANGIGLTALRKLSPKKAGFGALRDLPCHLNEHPSFTNDLTEYVNENVWGQLEAPPPPCKDKSEDIKIQLKDVSTTYYEFLIDRGKEKGGAAKCWVNRHKPEFKNIWYIPFSMNPGTPKPVLPPPNVHERKGTVDEWLENIFSIIK